MGEKNHNSDASLTPEAVALNDLFINTWWRVQRFQSAEFEGPRAMDSVTIGQLRILRGLLDGPLPMASVAGLAGVTPGAATGMVDRLVARGLVKRYVDRANRRRVKVAVTPEGRRLQAEAHQKAIRRANLLTQCLTKQEVDDFRRWLLALAERVAVAERQKTTS